MSSGSSAWTTLFATLSTGDGTFVPTTGWMTAAEAAKVRATRRLRSRAIHGAVGFRPATPRAR